MEINFVKAKKSDIPNLRALWLESFNEKPEAVDLIMESFDIFLVYCAKIDDKIVAGLYLLKGSVNGFKAHYMLGVATAVKFRKMGIMSRLIDFSLEQARQDGYIYSLLYPAEESLYSYYKKFGYSELFSVVSFEKSREELEQIAEGLDCNRSCPDFDVLQKKCFVSNYFHTDRKYFDFAAEYYNIYGVKAVFSEKAFVIFEDGEEKATIVYCVYDDFVSVASLLLENSKAERFVFTTKPENNTKFNKMVNGMIKSLNDDIDVCNEAYIGITLA